MSDWKKRLGVLYSTNPNYEYDYIPQGGEEQTLAKEKQALRVSLDKKQRRGKEVTLITGYVGAEEDLKQLAKDLKVKLGVGGSSSNGEILLQGNHVEKVKRLLLEEGYTKTK